MRDVMTRRAFLAAAGTAGALAYARPARTADADGTAEAAPYEIDGAAQAASYRIGQQPLKLGDDRDGLLYIPRGYKAGVAMPLILMLHGAGNTALSVTYTFEIADDLGFIILAPDSRDESTWDMLLHGFGEDVEFIGAALKDTYARCAVY